MSKSPAVWRIYFIPECSFTRPKAKDKLVAIVCHDGRNWGFLINSRIDPWIEIDPDKLACQAEIKEAEHDCLNRDSFVDCLDLYPFEDFELDKERDDLSPAAKASVLSATEESRTISIRHKQLILGS